MANQTITTNKTISQVITDGLTDGDNITINNGAILTVDVSPSVLIGQITVNQGKILFDGANATNPIIFTGEQTEEINVNGAGTLQVTLGWWEFPTTGDGTNGQTFDASTYFSADTNNNITADVFSGVWVETGREIDYDNGVGILPAVGDWVYKTSDPDVLGRIESVSGTATSGTLTVTFLTGALADNDSIEIRKIVENDRYAKNLDWVSEWCRHLSFWGIPRVWQCISEWSLSTGRSKQWHLQLFLPATTWIQHFNLWRWQ